MDTSTLDGMIAWVEHWKPMWHEGRRLGMLRLAVEDGRSYCKRWPSAQATEMLDLLLVLMIAYGASNVSVCRCLRGRVPIRIT